MEGRTDSRQWRAGKSALWSKRKALIMWREHSHCGPSQTSNTTSLIAEGGGGVHLWLLQLV